MKQINFVPESEILNKPMEVPALINFHSTPCKRKTGFKNLMQNQEISNGEGEACVSVNGADRISALPDSLILLILSFLPTKEVVKTSILAKRWQFIWTSVDAFTFICEHNPYNDIFQKFIEFVNSTLMRHDGSRIRKFSIRCEASGITDICDAWIRFATNNNVEDLELGFENDFAAYSQKYYYKMPMHLYSNLSLKNLKLKHCFIESPCMVSWPCLKTLVLQNLRHATGMMVENILSGCPSLQVLELLKFQFVLCLRIKLRSLKKFKLDHYNCESSLQIEAPNLQELEITGELIDLALMLVNVNSLAQLKLNANIFVMYDQKLMQLLASVRHVGKLILNFKLYEPLLCSSLGSDIVLGAFSCKYLVLHSSITKFETCRMLMLLQNAPHLETLVINMDRYHRLNIGKEACLDKQKGTEFLSCLRIVKIVSESFHLYEKLSALELVEFLLKYGQSLETVCFEWKAEGETVSSNHMSEKSHLLAEKLLNFPRASSRVKISFCVLSK